MYKNLKEQYTNIIEAENSSFKIFDGNFVGSIDKYIKEKIYDENNKLIKIININNDSFNLLLMTNELPLILDSIKPYFYLIKTKYNIVLIENVKYLMYECENEITLSKYMSSKNDNCFLMENVRRRIVFNWLMCIKKCSKSYYEENIYIKTYNPLITRVEECSNLLKFFTINENDYYTDILKNSEIPKSVLDEWFNGSYEIFYSYVQELLKGIDVNILRSKISNIIGFYNGEYAYWLNSVYDRILNAKNLNF
jgi:hypothetical protein